MRVSIVHETVYRYESPANYSVQYLRLSPRSTGRQNVISWKIETPGSVRHWVDAFGNDAHVLVVDRPHGELWVRARGEVDVNDEGLAVEELGPQSADIYLRPTALTTADTPLTAFAEDFRRDVEKDRKKGLEMLMRSLRDRVEYKPGVTHAATSAADAFARGAGVCQDHAHVFLACCRALNVPVRYVSGYLAAEGNDHLASHAWAEAWTGEQGWLGYDVANRIAPGGRHVRLAVGLDYLDACPVRGFRRGGNGESMDVKVHVHDAQRARPIQSLTEEPLRSRQAQAQQAQQ